MKIKPMKENTINIVPTLRFPEFLYNREWEEDSVENLFTFLPNNTLSRAELNYEKGLYLNIHYGDIRRTRIFPWHSPLTIHSHK
jgi:hypothetical protein